METIFFADKFTKRKIRYQAVDETGEVTGAIYLPKRNALGGAQPSMIRIQIEEQRTEETEE